MVYSCTAFPLRAANWNHLYCFRRHSPHRFYYLNVAIRRIPRYLSRIRFDLVIFDTLFMCNRWVRESFLQDMDRVQELSRIDAVKVAIPQDEFINTDLLCEFVERMELDVVFTTAPSSEIPKIYGDVRERVRFRRVLTGYLDDRLIGSASTAVDGPGARPIDIGYRTAGKPYPWFGRHGYLKQRIAEVVQAAAPRHGLRTDISTSGEDTLLRGAWFAFLRDCKYMIGTEGGTSILDRDGSIHQRTADYLRAHPKASFEEVEASCFPGLDGSFALFAISPRHLEACATGTCQILTAGEYNGVLEAGRHYLELARDFSNLDEILDEVRSDRRRVEITETAREEIVASGRYSYRAFCDFVVGESVSGGR